MRGEKPTNTQQGTLHLGLSALAAAGFFATPASAQNEPQTYGIEIGWEFCD